MLQRHHYQHLNSAGPEGVPRGGKIQPFCPIHEARIGPSSPPTCTLTLSSKTRPWQPIFRRWKSFTELDQKCSLSSANQEFPKGLSRGCSITFMPFSLYLAHGKYQEEQPSHSSSVQEGQGQLLSPGKWHCSITVLLGKTRVSSQLVSSPQVQSCEAMGVRHIWVKELQM